MMGRKMNFQAAERKSSNMTAEVRLSTFVVCLFSLFLFASPAFSASAKGLQVLKLSPRDRTAVVRGSDGKIKMVREGDEISDQLSAVRKDSDQHLAIGSQKDGDQKRPRPAFSSKAKSDENQHILTVTEIAEDRIVLEEKRGDEVETVIVRLEKGKQKVDRIRTHAPKGKQMGTTAVGVQR